MSSLTGVVPPANEQARAPLSDKTIVISVARVATTPERQFAPIVSRVLSAFCPLSGQLSKIYKTSMWRKPGEGPI